VSCGLTTGARKHCSTYTRRLIPRMRDRGVEAEEAWGEFPRCTPIPMRNTGTGPNQEPPDTQHRDKSRQVSRAQFVGHGRQEPMLLCAVPDKQRGLSSAPYLPAAGRLRARDPSPGLSPGDT
jgi:hypothetical protein